MDDVRVSLTESDGGWTAEVVVAGGGSSTRHEVTLSRGDYERLAGGKASPEALVEASFAFLLEREPKESILRRFDLPVIGRYFPDYERVIAQRL